MTQTELVLNRLRRGPVDSPKLVNIALRYTDTIFKLRNRGHVIQSDKIKGKNYCRYTLIKECDKKKEIK
jgi:hypothetical protein